MYACICLSIKDDEITSLLKEGFDIEEIIEKTGASMSCGTCFEHIKKIIHDNGDINESP